VEGIVAAVGEVFIAIAAAVLEIFLYIIAASIRPWRYILSSKFRERTNQQFIGKSIFVKLWFLFLGSIAAILGLVVIGLIVWFLVATFQRPTQIDKQETILNIGGQLLEQFRKHKEGNP
jgi:hypothetical protein